MERKQQRQCCSVCTYGTYVRTWYRGQGQGTVLPYGVSRTVRSIELFSGGRLAIGADKGAATDWRSVASPTRDVMNANSLLGRKRTRHIAPSFRSGRAREHRREDQAKGVTCNSLPLVADR